MPQSKLAAPDIKNMMPAKVNHPVDAPAEGLALCLVSLVGVDEEIFCDDVVSVEEFI
jgi:hypothetical protein